MQKLAILIAVQFILLTSVCAQSLFPAETPSFGRKVRNLGMGNTGVALFGTHDSSPFYNPAGLNDLKDGRIQFFAITGEIAKGSIGLVGDVKDLVDNVDNAPDQAGRVTALDNFIKDHTGEFEYTRFALDLVNYARKNFAVGVTFDEKMSLSVRNQSFPHADVQNIGDLGFYVSGSTGFWDKILQIGATMRPTIRFAMNEGDQQLTYSDVVTEDANGDAIFLDQMKNIYQQQRFSIAMDVGMKSNLAFPVIKDQSWFTYLRPEIGFTWQDIGDPSFDDAVGNEHSINTGIAVHPDFWILKNSVALDFRDLNHDRDFLTKVHFGVESTFDTKINLALRAGMSQGYFTAGATVDLWIVKLDGAIYNEEIGTNTRQEGNTRYAFTLSFNI